MLSAIPVERIRQEFDKMLMHASARQSLEDLKRIGFLHWFLPEVACLEDYAGNKYHQEGDVWIHTMMCVSQMVSICDREGVTGERRLMLMWAILLHDIGK